MFWISTVRNNHNNRCDIILHAKFAKKTPQSTQRENERFSTFFAKNFATFACKFNLLLGKTLKSHQRTNLNKL